MQARSATVTAIRSNPSACHAAAVVVYSLLNYCQLTFNVSNLRLCLFVFTAASFKAYFLIRKSSLELIFFFYIRRGF